jgi:hypothetical protein
MNGAPEVVGRLYVWAICLLSLPVIVARSVTACIRELPLVSCTLLGPLELFDKVDGRRFSSERNRRGLCLGQPPDRSTEFVHQHRCLLHELADHPNIETRVAKVTR